MDIFTSRVTRFSGVILSVLLLLAAGCGEEKIQSPSQPKRVFPGYHELLDEIVRSDSGIFRGLNLNSTAATVRQVEPSEPAEISDGHLYYEYTADTATNYSIDYSFENDTLSEINVQINSRDMELSNYLFCDLKDYYANKLPNPTEDKGYVVYNCFEGQRMPFVVSLSDNSTTGTGIINMVIYKDK